MIAPEVAFDKLAGFQTRDEIRDYLVGEQIKGQKKCHLSCPLARFLTHQTHMTSSVGVYQTDVYSASAQTVLVRDNTPAMVDFVLHFDYGHYPELEEEDTTSL